jgi:DNA (cytosine-5)-methyltransferase 1
MGYPDDFRIVVSDTQAYRQFGNSVVMPVVEKIAECVLSSLKLPVNYQPDLVLREKTRRVVALPSRKEVAYDKPRKLKK